MKNWFKKTATVILTAAMALSFSLPTFAAETIDIDEELRSRGYPQILLENMTDSAKQSLYKKENAIFSGGSITTYNQESGEYTSYEIPADGIATVGQIPEEDLTLSCITSKIGNTHIFVEFSYTWNDLPIFRWQDPISISWNDDLFEMQSGSFYKVDMYDAINDRTLEKIYGGVKSEQYSYASASPSGVTWYADLKGYGIDIIPTSLYGHAEFTLLKDHNATGNSRLYGHYVHPTASTTLSVTIPNFGNFNVSGAGAYDELGDDWGFLY